MTREVPELSGTGIVTALGSVGHIGALELRNRVVFPPTLTNFASDRGEVTDRLLEYYRRRAAGGYGLLITEACSVQYKGGVATRGLALYDERFVPGINQLATAVHSEGAKLGVQLFYDGAGFDYAPDDTPKVGPSDLRRFQGPYMRPMRHDEIREMASSFGQAASLAVTAGADLVEIHMAHGHLLGRFLSPHFNRRKDRYGGSLDGRLRFPLLVLETIKGRIDKHVPVSCRLSLSERLPDGLEIDDAIQIVKALAGGGLDAVHTSVGTGTDLGRASIFPTSFSDEAPFAPWAERVRRETNVTVIFAGKVVSADRGAHVVRAGIADFVSVGRGGIADPDWPRKALASRGSRKPVPCLSCNEGCVDHLLRSREITCTVNPWVGFEPEARRVRKLRAASEFLVIGGGIAGLTLAMTISRRGGKVTIFEQDRKLGGQYRWAGVPPGKHQYQDYLDYVLNQVRDTGCQIHTNRTVTERDLSGLPIGHVFWAGGAVPRHWIPEGLESPTIDGWSAFEQIKVARAQHIVVIGAGQTGSDVALWLASRGSRVTLLDRQSEPLAALGARRYDYKIALAENHVRLQFDSEVVGAEGTRLLWRNRTGTSGYVRVDFVVTAIGRVPKARPSFLGGAIGVGDCLRPTNALEAIRQATFHGAFAT